MDRLVFLPFGLLNKIECDVQGHLIADFEPIGRVVPKIRFQRIELTATERINENCERYLSIPEKESSTIWNSKQRSE